MNRSLFLILLWTCLCCVKAQIGVNANQGSEGIVVATWNIGHFAKGRGFHSLIKMSEYKKKSVDFRALVYDSIAADILCVNEYSREFCRDSSITIIAEDSIFNRYKVIKVFPQNKYVCNVIFSNKQISNSLMQPFHYNDSDKVATDDAVSWYYYTLADISIGGKDVKLVCTHLIANYKKNRQDQINEIIKECERFERVIICGDFNTWDFTKFKELGYTLANDGKMVTFPSKSYALDNIIVKGLRTSDVRVVRNDLSDHYAVVCSISL